MMKKRILSILLCCVMQVGLLLTAAFAEGSMAPADIAGTGTADDPYLISTKAQLEVFRDIVNNGRGELCAKLTADIDLEGSETNQWTPIGTSSSGFAGTFDGNGKTISGLYINEGGKKYQGLFSHSIGAKPGTIKNLRVKGRVTGSYYVGGIVGKNWGTVSGCSFEGSVTAVEHYPGGIVGENTGVIQNCMNAAAVTGDNYCGGISATNDGKISDCYNIGTVTATGNSGNASGIAAVNYQAIAKIVNCYNIGTLKQGKMGHAFGITRDRDNNNGEIINCYYLAADGLSSGGSGKEKSKTEFVDGTVLGLLKSNPSIWGDSQWEKCGYLEAARMIVPLLKWQTADAHTCTPGAVLGQCDCGGRINDGTAENPYEIYTAEHLKAFRNKVNGDNTDICGKLTADIVLNDGTFDKDGNYTVGASGADAEQWTPINGYAGTFDGQGYTVKGLYVKGEKCAGLFGSVRDGTVKNVAVTGCVDGTQYVGGVVGYGSNATISGCTNHAAVKATYDTYFDIVSGTISGGANAGGIAGCLQTGTISNCANIGGITALCTKNWGECSAGGIVGRTGENDGTVITITACASLGDVSAFLGANNTEAYVGGIAGEMMCYTSIVDCLNAGELSVTEEDAVTPKSGYIGGIFGFFSPYNTADWLPSTSTSNCYSVGTLTHTGSGPVTIRGIAGGAKRYSFTNCYWLEGTAEYAVDGSPYRVIDTSAKSKTEFANGTVLKLLKGGHTNTWTKCGYLEAARMTLPLLKWQTADNHNHSYKWEFTDDEHWKECACGAIDKDSTASHKEAIGICTEGIKCECGYEMIRAKNEHNWSDWVHNITSHIRKCDNKGCGITETKNCSDENKDHKCDTCEAVMSQCTDNNKDHKCDTCDKVLSECDDADKDHKCDICGKPLSEHTGGEATCKDKATCEVCGEKYGELKAHSFTAENTDAKYLKTAAACTKQAVYYRSCAACGLSSEGTADEATFQSGDVLGHNFGTWNSNADGTHAKTCQNEGCAVSETKLCSGGSADCHSKAICEICGEGYGEVNISNHTGGTEIRHAAKAACAADGYTGDTYCKGCNTVLDHGKAISATGHTGGEATCKDKATCVVCGEKYGEFADHSYETTWSNDDTKHWHKCSVCGVKKDEAAHSYGEWNEIKSATETEKGLKEHICSACSYKETKDIPALGHTHSFENEWKHNETNHWHECACGEKSGNAAHTGGTATRKEKAVCEVCGESYGKLNTNSHAGLKHIDAKAATKTNEGNIEYWYCEGCGKYFADKDGIKGIAKADTVTAKLPEERPAAPATGDTSNLTLWIALLFVSGSVMIGTVTIGKKKKQQD